MKKDPEKQKKIRKIFDALSALSYNVPRSHTNQRGARINKRKINIWRNRSVTQLFLFKKIPRKKILILLRRKK